MDENWEKINVQIPVITVPCLLTMKTKRYSEPVAIVITLILHLWLSVIQNVL